MSMSNKERPESDSRSQSVDSRNQDLGNKVGTVDPGDSLESLKKSIGIMKKAGERLGSLRKGEVPEQRN